MRYLFFTNTPAHVHLYRNVVEDLRARGHEVEILARDYGCTVDLLEWYDLPHSVYGYCDTNMRSLFLRLPAHYARIARRARSFDPDLVFGMGAYSAHAGLIARAPTILVLDSEPTSLDHAVSAPFARAILTPDAFRKDLGGTHYTFPGFKECAYLHPDAFDPDEGVRRALGVGDDSYAIVRFNAFGSHHDVGKGGFSPAERQHLIETLDERVEVFVSDEGGDLDFDDSPARPFDLHPARLHDALAGADLLVADTQTMVTEAALLGTPAVRSNSFVGDDDMGNFITLEEHRLVRNCADMESVLETVTELLDEDGVKRRWRRQRDRFMDEAVNLTDLLVDVATAPEAIDEVDGLSQRSDDRPRVRTGRRLPAR